MDGVVVLVEPSGLGRVRGGRPGAMDGGERRPAG